MLFVLYVYLFRFFFLSGSLCMCARISLVFLLFLFELCSRSNSILSLSRNERVLVRVYLIVMYLQAKNELILLRFTLS